MLWATYYQQIINYHWMSYLANASLCSEWHPDTQLTWLTTVLLKWPISVHVFKLAIVPWLLFTQCRDNKACKLRQGWAKRVFPTLSCTELHNFLWFWYTCRSWQKIVQFNLIDSKLGILLNSLFHFAGWDQRNYNIII